MSCNCGKPKCDGKCGISPSVLQINNPGDCTLFHRVEVPASMGDSKTNPPKNGDYRNVLLYYVADGTSWLFSSDGIPQKLVNGFTNYEDAINLPQINGETLIGDKSSADLKLADAPMVITIASGNTVWSGADTAEDIYNFFLNQGKVNVVFEGSENYGYGIVSAAYIPGEQKMMCMTTVASVDTGSSPVEFSNGALYGLMTFYTADKAVDVGELDLQPKLFITDFTGLELYDNVLSGVPATDSSIGMVKPGDGLEVAQDGTLSVSDIEQYAHFFDTISDMQSATNLVAGSYAKTLGYYAINDGGGSLYYITDTGTADGGNVIAVGDLFAHLVIENDTINVAQFGAKGDGSTDDTDAINMALATGVSNVNFVTGKTYMVRGYGPGQGDETQSDWVLVTGLVIKDNQDVNLNGATVKCITNSRKSYNIFTIAEVDNVKLHNGTIIGDRTTHTGVDGEWGYGVAIKFATNVTLENLFISECWGDGICTNHNGDSTDICENIYIRNCICKSNRRQGFSHQNGIHTVVEDCEFSYTGDNGLHTNPSDGVDIEPGTNSNKVKDISFNRCIFKNNYNSGIQVKGNYVDGADNIDNVRITNCKFIDNIATTANADLNVGKSYNVVVENCEFSNKGNDANEIISINTSNDILFLYNKIDNGRLVLKSDNMSNSAVKIKGNVFTSDKDQPYNAVVQTGSGGTGQQNNTLIVEDNIFTGTPTLSLTAWVQCTHAHKFEKLVVKNNSFKYGNKNISTDSSNIIENNNFIAPSNYSIILNTGNSDQVTTLKGNVFEEVGYNLSAGGAVNNANNNNIIAQDNIIYSNCTTKADNQTKTYDNTSRLLQITTATTGVSLDENNNFFSNTYA